MGATSDVKVTPGSGKNVATYSVTEDAETKELQRVVPNNSAGVELGTPTNPQSVSLSDGTQTANTLAGDSGQNAMLVAPARKEVFFTTTTAQPVAVTDVSNYRWVSVQIVTQGTSSTVTFQGSNDNTNWVSMALMISTAVGTTVPTVSSTAVSSYVGPLHFRYFRLNVTGISAGTTAGVVEFMAEASQMPLLYSPATQLALADNADGVVASATANALKTHSSLRLFGGTNYDRARSVVDGTNTVGTGVMAVGNLAQFDDVAPTTITEGQFGNLRMSNNRNLYGTIRDAAGNERGVNVNAANEAQVNASQNGTWTVQPGNTANTTAWLVTEAPRSVSSQTALTTTATVSASAGRFGGGSFINLNATPVYIQVFDTTGAVTLGTTVPTFVQPIPANSTAALGAAYVFNIHPGITVANGIKIAATTTATGLTTVGTALTGYIHYI